MRADARCPIYIHEQYFADCAEAKKSHHRHQKQIWRNDAKHTQRVDTLKTILTIPGLGGSGPGHWQTYWDEHRPGCKRVHQGNWNIPDYEEWMDGLHNAITACDEPPILVAHSLSCALVAHWAVEHPDIPVHGALLVAPADVDSEEHTPPETWVFSPIPMMALPFPSTVVASSNDPYVSLQRAQVFATAWGASFVNIGPHGHINADAHLKDWDEGWAFLEELGAQKNSLSSA